MLLCCSFAASFTSRNPSSLFVDHSNSRIYPICRASLIRKSSGRLPQKWFTKKDSGSRLYCASHLFLTGHWWLSPVYPVPFPPDLPCCRFLKLFLSPQHAYVTFFVKRDKLELALWLLSQCSVPAVIQVPPDAVVGNRNCCCHSFTACTVKFMLTWTPEHFDLFCCERQWYMAPFVFCSRD